MSNNDVECLLTIHDMQNVSFKMKLQEAIPGSLGYDKLTEMSVDRLNFWVNYSVDNEANIKSQESLCNVSDLKTLGLHLYKILFADEKVRSAFATMYKEFSDDYSIDKTKRLRLNLKFERKALKLAGLPWEFLYVPTGGKLPVGDDIEGVFFSGRNAELVLIRSVVPQSNIVQEIKEQETPLRILIVICQPHGLETLDKREIEEVKAELKSLEALELVQVDIKENLTSKQLKDELNPKAPHRPPHILHFIGHGEKGKIALIMDKDDDEYRVAAYAKTGASIENPVKWISKDDLIGGVLPLENKPRLIFLQVCKGASQGTLESFKSTASELVYDANIPAVVAMQYSISNDDARVFAKAFYNSIAKGEMIDKAVKSGRIELGGRSPAWQHPRFGTPVVYLQSNKAIVVSSLKVGSELQRECANCNTPNPISSKFCKECGSHLSLSIQATMPAAGQPSSQTVPSQERIQGGVAENPIPSPMGGIGERKPSVRIPQNDNYPLDNLKG